MDLTKAVFFINVKISWNFVHVLQLLQDTKHPQALRARGLLPGGHSEDEDDAVSGGSDGLAASEAIVEITKQGRF